MTSGLVENLYPRERDRHAKSRTSTPARTSFSTKWEAEVKETSVAECKKEWFEVTPASPGTETGGSHTVNQGIPATEMKEEAAVNQNACKGASVTLHYKAS